MKKLVIFVSLALSVMLLVVLTVPTSIAAKKADADYQRYITFHNDFNFPIYPVIQVPADLCDGEGVTSVRRIIVNGSGGNGLQANETLTVLIPNESVTTQDSNGNPLVKRCWYQSGRIYIFPIALATFEANMIQVDSNNSDQVTTYPPPYPTNPPPKVKHPSVPVTCFAGKRNNQGKGASGNCKTGVANNSFAADVPAQLAEYTFDSDNGLANSDPDSGIAMADIDVSNVDDFYLPIAASVVNNGATGYMGGATTTPHQTMLSTVQQQLSNFFSTNPWSIYAAYLAKNQPSPPAINNAVNATQFPPSLGGGTGTPAPHLPGGFNIVQNTLSHATSAVYQFQNNAPGNYLLSGVTYDPKTRIPANPLMQPHIARWMWWVGQFNPDDPNIKNAQLTCSADMITTLNQTSSWPDGIQSSFDKQDFCNHYLTTVKDVWVHFLTDPNEGFEKNSLAFYSDCGLYDKNNKIPPPNDSNLQNACIIQHIVGYNSAIVGGQLPGEVQALLRGVAYNSADGLNPGNKQYQYDPFLTFAAPYNSKFNLDPYTRLIHSTKDGIGAVSYSFSIDDKYGNFRDASLGILIDAGGTTVLDNPQPYDPYQQYSMNWGYNRDKFSLLAVASGVNLANVQNGLKTIAANNKNQPFLIKQDQNISVFGHAAATGTNWNLTNPLVTLTQLQNAAQQEKARTSGATAYYQTLINYLFGNSTVQPPVQSIFPGSVWDGSSPNPAIALLDFDADPLNPDWGEGRSLLYGYISQQNADIPAKGNWVSADASQCGIPNPIAINGPGSQRIPVRLNQPCQVSLTDSFQEKLVFSLTPVSKPVTDNYTGAQVKVMSLPIGNQSSGTPPTSSNLTAADQTFCQNNSTTGRMQGYCNNINASAVWSGDRYSRDVVYMGLAFEDMPRVNVNLPNAPTDPPDPTAVNWPTNAAVTFQVQNGQIVQVNWPAAMTGANQKLQYTLYLLTGKNNGVPIWTPQACSPPNLPTSDTFCKVNLGQPATVYVLAQNVSVSPPPQSSPLYGCYPAAKLCPPATTTGKPTKTRPPQR